MHARPLTLQKDALESMHPSDDEVRIGLSEDLAEGFGRRGLVPGFSFDVVPCTQLLCCSKTTVSSPLEIMANSC
jgi:hypothetical protein